MVWHIHISCIYKRGVTGSPPPPPRAKEGARFGANSYKHTSTQSGLSGAKRSAATRFFFFFFLGAKQQSTADNMPTASYYRRPEVRGHAPRARPRKQLG